MRSGFKQPRTKVKTFLAILASLIGLAATAIAQTTTTNCDTSATVNGDHVYGSTQCTSTDDSAERAAQAKRQADQDKAWQDVGTNLSRMITQIQASRAAKKEAKNQAASGLEDTTRFDATLCAKGLLSRCTPAGLASYKCLVEANPDACTTPEDKAAYYRKSVCWKTTHEWNGPCPSETTAAPTKTVTPCPNGTTMTITSYGSACLAPPVAASPSSQK